MVGQPSGEDDDDYILDLEGKEDRSHLAHA